MRSLTALHEQTITLLMLGSPNGDVQSRLHRRPHHQERRYDAAPVGDRGERPGRRASLALAGIIAILLVAAVAVADRGPMRSAEAAYLDGRNVTACATRELRPFAEAGRDLDELPATLEALIADAHVEAREVRDRSLRGPGGVLPATRAAVRSVRAALHAQVDLYRAMAEDPAGSDDELAALGRANRSAERALDRARRWTVSDPADPWPDRFTCRGEAEGQASSPSSSSK